MHGMSFLSPLHDESKHKIQYLVFFSILIWEYIHLHPISLWDRVLCVYFHMLNGMISRLYMILDSHYALHRVNGLLFLVNVSLR